MTNNKNQEGYIDAASDEEKVEGLFTSNTKEDEVIIGTVDDKSSDDDDEDLHPDANWFVVHTYSGHENKVKANIEKIVESKGMEDEILKIEVPTQTIVETKDGVRKEKTRIIFPGYVIIKMYMNDKSWFVVRNTRGVTGFVGAGTKPTALTRTEIENMGLVKRTVLTDYAVGDNVVVIAGYLEGNEGVVEEIYPEKQAVKVLISMFGKDTPVEMEFENITRIKPDTSSGAQWRGSNK